jgi:plasmid stabilization system protein ParE
MKRYRVSKEAENDLDEIFAYWAERANLDIADRLIDAIVDRFWLLGEYPESGRACDDIQAGTRCVPAGKYLIYYRKMRRRVEIAHVFRGARDQRKAWRDSKG